jgi:3-oxoacyl-[acyl-carrier-protein] synthase II
MSRRRVVITGMGIVSPLGCDLNRFWERLVKGQSGIRRMQSFDASLYTSQIAGEVVEFAPEQFLEKKELRHMDPFCTYGIAAAKMAVADSGLDFSKEDPLRSGVVIGTGVGGLQVLIHQMDVLRQKGPHRFSPFMIPQMLTNILAGHVAIKFNLQGPNFCLVSACATATHSMGESLRMIQHGEADVMLRRRCASWGWADSAP